MKVSEKYYDEIFDFAGQWEQPSSCGLRILNGDGNKIIVVTELYQDNPGTSITAAGGNLAKQICEKKGVNINNIMYIECKPDTNSKLSFYDEDYFEVTFNKVNGQFTQPKYRKLSAEEIKTLMKYQ
jgi:hypothetical protein